MAGTFSIPIQESIVVVSAATSKGDITVPNANEIYPGTFGWLVKDDASARVRVQIVRIVSGNVVAARAMPDNETTGAPNYGRGNFLVYNGSAKLYIEAQTASVTFDHVGRNIG